MSIALKQDELRKITAKTSLCQNLGPNVQAVAMGASSGVFSLILSFSQCSAPLTRCFEVGFTRNYLSGFPPRDKGSIQPADL